MSDEVAQPADVNGSHLLHEYPSRLVKYLDFRAERGGASASRGRCDQDDRTREELIGLDDNPESVTALLMTDTLWDLQAVHVTAEHAGTP